MSILRQGQLMTPGGGVRGDEAMQGGLQILVSSLCDRLSVGGNLNQVWHDVLWVTMELKKICWTGSSAISLAEGNLVKATKWAHWCAMVIVVLPPDGGRPVTKSTEIWDQGQQGDRERMECFLSGGLIWFTGEADSDERMCVHVQSGPPETSLQEGKSVTQSRMAGEIRLVPPMDNLRPDRAGNIKTISRHITKTGCCCCARLTANSVSQVTAATTQDGRIGPGSRTTATGLNCFQSTGEHWDRTALTPK